MNYTIQSRAQVWIKIYGPRREYWHPRILMTVAREVGISLQIDQAMREKKYGYFAKTLVKVDFHGDLMEIFAVELSDYGWVQC